VIGNEEVVVAFVLGACSVALPVSIYWTYLTFQDLEAEACVIRGCSESVGDSDMYCEEHSRTLEGSE